MKAVSESSYQKIEFAFKEKSTLAPLARMESFPENDDEQEQVILPTAPFTCQVFIILLLRLRFMQII